MFCRPHWFVGCGQPGAQDRAQARWGGTCTAQVRGSGLDGRPAEEGETRARGTPCVPPSDPAELCGSHRDQCWGVSSPDCESSPCRHLEGRLGVHRTRGCRAPEAGSGTARQQRPGAAGFQGGSRSPVSGAPRTSCLVLSARPGPEPAGPRSPGARIGVQAAWATCVRHAGGLLSYGVMGGNPELTKGTIQRARSPLTGAGDWGRPPARRRREVPRGPRPRGQRSRQVPGARTVPGDRESKGSAGGPGDAAGSPSEAAGGRTSSARPDVSGRQQRSPAPASLTWRGAG